MFHFLILLLALVPSAAAAQQVHKCVKGSEIAYQSAPCEDGRTEEKSWDHGSYQPPAPEDLQRIRETQQATSRRDKTAGQSRRRSTATQSRAAKSTIGRCQEAKAHRDRELYKLGPRKSIEALRSWDAYIAEACCSTGRNHPGNNLLNPLEKTASVRRDVR